MVRVCLLRLLLSSSSVQSQLTRTPHQGSTGSCILALIVFCVACSLEPQFYQLYRQQVLFTKTFSWSMKQAQYLPLQLVLCLTALFKYETASIVDSLRPKPYWLDGKIWFRSTHVRKHWSMIFGNSLCMHHNMRMPLYELGSAFLLPLLL